MTDIASFNTVEEIEQLRKWQKEYMGKFEPLEEFPLASYDEIRKAQEELIKRVAVMPPMPAKTGTKTWIEEVRQAQEQKERDRLAEQKAMTETLRELQAAEQVRKRKEAERLAKEEEEERKARILEEMAQTTDWDL